MNFLLWLLILSFFTMSFIALVYPVLPSITGVWAGFLLYHFGVNSNNLTSFFWIIMGLFTLILLFADIFSSSLSVEKYGGSQLGKQVAGVSVVVGSFVYPPIGIIVLPFLAVFLAEWSQKRSLRESWNAALGSLVGFLRGQMATAVIQLLMIIWFFFTIWF